MQKHKQMFKFKMLSYGRFVQSKNTDEHNKTVKKKIETYFWKQTQFVRVKSSH